jgi:hypothetical protein
MEKQLSISKTKIDVTNIKDIERYAKVWSWWSRYEKRVLIFFFLRNEGNH